MFPTVFLLRSINLKFGHRWCFCWDREFLSHLKDKVCETDLFRQGWGSKWKPSAVVPGHLTTSSKLHHNVGSSSCRLLRETELFCITSLSVILWFDKRTNGRISPSSSLFFLYIFCTIFPLKPDIFYFADLISLRNFTPHVGRYVLILILYKSSEESIWAAMSSPTKVLHGLHV